MYAASGCVPELHVEASLVNMNVRAGRREWAGLAVLALPIMLVALDGSVLFLALPSLSADLDVTSSQQLWIVDIYVFMVAGFLITMGGLGDRVGRRKLLLFGAGAFTLASLLAAYANSAETLIAARTIQGIAGAIVMPMTLALINDMFTDAHQRVVAIAVRTSSLLVGAAVGPVIGGLLLEWFWWGSVFLVGVPVMGVLLVAGLFLLPEDRNVTAPGTDVISVGLSLAAVLPAIYGIKELSRNGWHVLPVVAAGVGLVIGVLFVIRQRRLDYPLVDLRLFHNRQLGTIFIVMFTSSLVLGGTFLFVPLYLQSVEGLSPLRAGLLLVPQSVTTIVSTIAVAHLARQFRVAHVLAFGLVVAAAGCLMLAMVDSTVGLPLIIGGSVLASIGVVPVVTLATSYVMGAVPLEKSGAGSSIVASSKHLGTALGLAILGSIGAAIYRNKVVVPDDVPPQMAATAHEALAGAVAVAHQLPPEMAENLVNSARAAFTAGLNIVGAVGAVLLMVSAALTVFIRDNK